MNASIAAYETSIPARPRFGRRVGLLAGGGRFPVYFAEAARRQRIEVVCVAVRGHADAALQAVVDRFHWTGLFRIGQTIRCFRKESIDCVVMAGKIHKVAMFAPIPRASRATMPAANRGRRHDERAPARRSSSPVSRA